MCTLLGWPVPYGYTPSGDRIVFLTKIRKKQGRDQVALSNAYIDLTPETTPTTTTPNAPNAVN